MTPPLLPAPEGPGHRLLHTLLGLALAVASCSPGAAPARQSADATGPTANDAPPAGTGTAPTPLAPLSVVSVEPDRAPIWGGVQVDITGTGFVPGARVYIGGVEAPVDFLAGSTHVFVTIPASAKPGLADVKVTRPASKAGAGLSAGPVTSSEAVLASGFLYLADISVDAVDPPAGAIGGGTQVTVTGHGFTEGMRLLFGTSEAIGTQILDPNTAIALTPPAPNVAGADASNVQVAMRHPTGLATLPDGFTYLRAPVIQNVVPAAGPLGGSNVTVHGVALGPNNVSSFLFGALPGTILDLATPSDAPALLVERSVHVPARLEPGAVDVRAMGPGGVTVLPNGFAYLPDDPQEVTIYGLTPAFGSTKGGALLQVLAAIPAGVVATALRFGDVEVPVEYQGYLVVATTPPHAAGTVDIGLVTSAGTFQRPAAFTFVAPMEAKVVSPKEGPAGGGTTLNITGIGFTPDVKVRVGALEALVVEVASDGTKIVVQTPPGSPGPADVEISNTLAQSHLGGAFTYTNGTLLLDGVVPPAGATGGFTSVTLHGTGFSEGMVVRFGGKPGMALSVVSPTVATLKTPPGDPGPVVVTVEAAGKGDTLIDGFTYYAPKNPQGGTWGPPTSGTLNVSVLDIYTLQGLPEAHVVVYSPGNPVYPKFKGQTDAAGQVVFSDPSLSAPLTISATKQSYTASSIVSYDAENATVLLWPYSPPSSGGEPTTPQSVPFGLVRGKVLDIDKYLQIPPGNCTQDPLKAPSCDKCEVDADCTDKNFKPVAGFACIHLGTEVGRCLPECSASDACGVGFVCQYPSPSAKAQRCVPSAGMRHIVCSASLRDLWTKNPDPGAGAVVDGNTGEFELTVRPDELAVYCVGGYLKYEAGSPFVMTKMGVHRHVFPKPFTGLAKDIVQGVDVRLDMALARKLTVHLDHPPANLTKEKGGRFTVDGWMDLGSDGMIPVANYHKPAPPFFGTLVDEYDIDTLPLLLSKDVTDTTFTWYARVEWGAEDEPPISATLHMRLDLPGEKNLWVRGVDGAWGDRSFGVNLTLSALATLPDGTIAMAGEDGTLLVGPLDGPTLLHGASPGAKTLGVMGTGPSDITEVGESGLIRHIADGLAKEEAAPVTKTLRAACQTPFARYAAGDDGTFLVHQGEGWKLVETVYKGQFRAMACAPEGVVAVGTGGTILTAWVVETELDGGKQVKLETKLEQPTDADLNAAARGPDGTILVGGDKGVLLVRKLEGPWPKPLWWMADWVDAWPKGFFAQKIDVAAVAPHAGGHAVVVDKDARILRFGPTTVPSPGGVDDESFERPDLGVRAIASLPDGRVVLAGKPGLWLGPFLQVPVITQPSANAKTAAPLHVVWKQAMADAGASFVRVHLDLEPGFPIWWIYANGTTQEVTLPDFKPLVGVNPFYPGKYRARVDRGYVPGFSINGFSTFDLEFDLWRSWAAYAVPFDGPP